MAIDDDSLKVTINLSDWGWRLGKLFTIFLIIILLSFLILTIQKVIVGELDAAGVYAGISVGIATILLVMVAGWYAAETRRLVFQTEQARIEEKEFRQNKRVRDIHKIRVALLQEIRAVEGLHRLARDYEPAVSMYTQIIPSKVFESNAGELGALSQKEIEAIIDYYTLGEMVEDHLAMQRKMDTAINQSVFEVLWRAISFEGLIFRKERQARTNMTAEKIKDLADAQQEAVDRIEENLEEGVFQ